MINFIFNSNLLEIISWTIIHSLWQITLLGIVCYFILQKVDYKNSNLRYNIVLSTISIILLTSLITFTYLYQGVQTTIIASTSIPSIGILNNTSLIHIDQSLLSKFNAMIMANYSFIAGIWMIGFAIFTTRLLLSYTYIQTLTKNAILAPNERIKSSLNTIKNKLNITQSIEIKWSNSISSPVVVGWLKPIILFPLSCINQLTIEETEAIIAHELAHVKRNDFIINILQSITEIIFYYHPIIWWLSGVLREEREHACDHLAIQCIGGNHMLYAKTLLSIEESYTIEESPLSLAFLSKKEQLLDRITRILNLPLNKNNMKTNILSILIISIIFLSFTIAEKGLPEIQPLNKLQSFVENTFSNTTLKEKAIFTSKPILSHQTDVTESQLLDTIPKKRKKKIQININEKNESNDGSSYITSSTKTINIEDDGTDKTIIIHEIENGKETIDTIITSSNDSSYENSYGLENEDDQHHQRIRRIDINLDSISHNLRLSAKDFQNEINSMHFEWDSTQQQWKDGLSNWNKKFWDQLEEEDIQSELKMELDHMMDAKDNLILEFNEFIDDQDFSITLNGKHYDNHNLSELWSESDDHTYFFHPRIDIPIPPTPPSPPRFHSSKHKTSSTPTDRLIQRLYNDRLIQKGENNKIKLSGRKMKINGKTQDKSIWLKYKKYYEDMIGTELTRRSKVEIKDYREK